ncbi:unnamed protein product, partial [Musa hybrid cultivar]
MPSPHPITTTAIRSPLGQLSRFPYLKRSKSHGVSTTAMFCRILNGSLSTRADRMGREGNRVGQSPHSSTDPISVVGKKILGEEHVGHSWRRDGGER